MATKFPKPLIAVPAILILGLIGEELAYADVVTDGSVGPRVELDGPEFDIGAELGRQAGRNLFHSFDRFSLSTGERATFSGPDQIRNVISRVTGGERSDIDGTIASTMPGADFYFINPAGVLFGPNASLDVKGSFHVSTADELRFEGGEVFSASDPAASSFTVARPEAFGFLGDSPAAILVDRSTLEVQAGNTISLVGGNLSVDGRNQGRGSATLSAPSGQINLVALDGQGDAGFGNNDMGADARGDVTLANDALVDVSGDGGGKILIRGGRVVIDNQSFVFADNSGATNSRGGINVVADSVHVRDNSVLTADVFGAGSGGTVSVSARRIEVAGSASRIRSDAFADGNAGPVTVSANHLEIRNGGVISSSTSAAGDAGTVTVTVAEDLNINQAGAGFTGITSQATRSSTGGDAGTVTVAAGSLTLLGGGQVSTSTFGPGAGGNVTVNAREMVVTGGDAATRFPSGVVASAGGP
jgi:filamentous hemagglutinin family protein